jgi:hypothetical protein
MVESAFLHGRRDVATANATILKASYILILKLVTINAIDTLVVLHDQIYYLLCSTGLALLIR